VVDSNCDPTGIDFVVPGNDDSIRAIQLYCSSVANACLEGETLFNDRVQTEKVATADAKAESKSEKPGSRTGRVVVEIKHPPRRGRGAAMAAEKREAERQAAEVEDTPAEAVAKPEAEATPEAEAKPEPEKTAEPDAQPTEGS
jgi:small subunit ribosomal protein S2